MTAAPSAASDALEPVKKLLASPAGWAVKGVVAFLGTYLACNLIFEAPLSIILDGIALGSLYGLIGAGVILIYRTNRIINFAAAGLGAVPGVAGVLLIVNKGISWWLIFPLTIVAGGVAGGLVDVIIIRRFAKAPRLILAVVTIGVAQLLAFISIYLPRWIKAPGRETGGQFISKVDTPFRDWTFIIGNRPFSGDYPFSVFFVLLMVVGLALFFRYTRIGIALRASAENADRASLLGIPVRRVGTVAWVLAGVFATVTIFLRSTLVGVPVDGTLGPVVLLYALAAAVVGRMESVPICLAAGVAIGMIDQSSVFKTARPSLAGAIMFVLILGALLLQRGRLSRAQDSGVSTFSMVREFRPTPAELRRVPEVVAARSILTGVVAIVALTAPFWLGDGRLSRAAPIVIAGIIAVSLVILTGWAGQISLGQYGLVGVGALMAGWLSVQYNLDFFATLVVGILAGAAAAVLIGLPALRIQGPYLAVTTLAFAGTVSGFVLNPRYPIRGELLGESSGRIERFVLWERFDLGSASTYEVFGWTIELPADGKYYYFCLFFLFAALAVARSYRRNRAGRILIATRDNSRAAPAYAINLARNKLAAFAVAGAFAGGAGVLLAFEQGAVDAESYGIGPSLLIFAATVIGGLTSLPGAVLGAITIQAVRTYGESVLTGLSLLVTGPGLVLVLLFLPGGLGEGLYRLRDSFLLWVAKRHDILVPSLVADRRIETGEDQQDVVTSAEHHVEEVESFDLTTAPTIACPICGEVMALEVAAEHEHLRAAPAEELQPVATGAPASDDITGTGGGRRRLAARRDARK